MVQSIIEFVKKQAAKWVLDYLPDAAVWAIKYGVNKTKDEEKWVAILETVKAICTDARMVASIMEDGIVTEVEEEQVRMRVSDLVEDVKDLL